MNSDENVLNSGQSKQQLICRFRANFVSQCNSVLTVLISDYLAFSCLCELSKARAISGLSHKFD